MFVKQYYKFALLLILFLLSTCTPAASQVVMIPTRAVLPSATPSPTDPPATATANLLETQIAQLNATNVAAEMTLALLLTGSAPTATAVPTMTPNITLTPSPTITNTLLPSTAPPLSVPLLLYAQSTANLRACAHRDCEQIAQLQAGEAVLATDSIEGEAIESGKSLWYRVDHLGRELYVYSQLVSTDPPATNPPIFAQPLISTLPPPVGSVGCPSLSATCSMMTCEQAYACLAAGNASLDRDHDGVPCESVCNS